MSAKKMAGGRGEKPPCRVRLLKRRRYVWAIKNNFTYYGTSSKNFCSTEFFSKIIITYPDKKKQVFFLVFKTGLIKLEIRQAVRDSYG